ncbi:MAG: hypothetical protein C5B53_08215 [Candidatus Melainabacteria bacterium]|nr:MAG: hypothetical protein C5B53_08215 [Candidatus Melainabacteria bacterium]
MKQDGHLKIEVREGGESCQNILTKSETGSWVLSLPPPLRANQNELEMMLIRVFSDKRSSAQNLALAQQLSLNWCTSQAFKRGLSLEDCWRKNSS